MRSRHPGKPGLRPALGKAALWACGLMLIVLLLLAFTDRLQPGRSVSLQLNVQPALNRLVLSQQGVNLNTASLEELMRLPGVGEHLAGLIVQKRQQAPFRFLEDLMAVPGFGARRLEALRNLAFVPLPESYQED